MRLFEMIRSVLYLEYNNGYKMKWRKETFGRE